MPTTPTPKKFEVVSDSTPKTVNAERFVIEEGVLQLYVGDDMVAAFRSWSAVSSGEDASAPSTETP